MPNGVAQDMAFGEPLRLRQAGVFAACQVQVGGVQFAPEALVTPTNLLVVDTDEIGEHHCTAGVIAPARRVREIAFCAHGRTGRPTFDDVAYHPVRRDIGIGEDRFAAPVAHSLGQQTDDEQFQDQIDG